MKTSPLRSFTALALLAFSTLLYQPVACAQGTAFTYQGFLIDGGAPAHGAYDLTFTLFDAATVGATVGASNVVNDLGVTNGLFTVALDYGSGSFDGSDRWLEIAVRPGASTDAYTNVAPRQPVRTMPYAIRALSFSGAISNAQLAGTYGNAVNISNAANVFGGSFSGNGGGLSNLNATSLIGPVPAAALSNAWRIGGNAGTIAANNFIGTTDDKPLELRVNNSRALRLQPDTSPANAPNVIGGSPVNVIAPGVVGTTIAGGGSADYEGNGPAPNTVGLSYGTVGGGVGNDTAGVGATIGGGYNNTSIGFFALVGGGGVNMANGDYASVGGGLFNQATNIASTVAGGRNNRAIGRYSSVGGGTNVQALGQYSTVGGGQNNVAAASSATVGGGSGNESSGTASTVAGGSANFSSGSTAAVGGGSGNESSGISATVAGGQANLSSGLQATVGGGVNNTSSGPQATVGGGDNNEAGNSFATVSGGGFNSARGGNATVGGGLSNQATNTSSTVAGGEFNRAYGRFSTVGGGVGNYATNSSSTIAGGRDNKAYGLYSTVGGGTNGVASGDHSTVGGGNGNESRGSDSIVAGGRANVSGGSFTTVGGGLRNESGGYSSTVAGGQDNISSGSSDTVGGGNGNESSGGGSTVGGGAENVSSQIYATVGGGYRNESSGGYSTVPGGRDNEASGTYSFASGHQAKANHTGTFVWADSEAANFASTAAQQFLIRAGGGVGIGHNAPDAPLHVVGGSDASLTGGGILVLGAVSAGNVAFDGNEIQARNNGAASALFFNASGGNVSIGTFTANARLRVVNATCDGSTWNNASDRNLKEHFESVDARDVLAKVAALPISRWNYTNAPGTRHIGPMAQDFQAAFGLGADDKTIATVDADGVALAAIQGLNEIAKSQAAEISALKQELAELRALIGGGKGGRLTSGQDRSSAAQRPDWSGESSP